MHYDIDRLSRGFSNDTVNIQMYTKSPFDGEKDSGRERDRERKTKRSSEKQGETKTLSIDRVKKTDTLIKPHNSKKRHESCMQSTRYMLSVLLFICEISATVIQSLET